jgi:hypothetical protein
MFGVLFAGEGTLPMWCGGGKGILDGGGRLAFGGDGPVPTGALFTMRHPGLQV